MLIHETATWILTQGSHKGADTIKQKRTNKLKSLISTFLIIGTLGANRTRDTRIRNKLLKQV